MPTPKEKPQLLGKKKRRRHQHKALAHLFNVRQQLLSLFADKLGHLVIAVASGKTRQDGADLVFEMIPVIFVNRADSYWQRRSEWQQRQGGHHKIKGQQFRVSRKLWLLSLNKTSPQLPHHTLDQGANMLVEGVLIHDRKRHAEEAEGGAQNFTRGRLQQNLQ